MSLLRKRNNKVAETLGLKAEIAQGELSPNSLVLNEIDRDIYHDMVGSYEAMQENLDNGLKEYAPFDYLSEDIFNSLFKYNAKLREEEDVKAFSRINHGMMSNMMESEEYQNLRKSTKFDYMSSALGTEVLQQKAMEQIMYYKKQYELQQQTGQAQPGADAGELINQMNKAKALQDEIDGLNAKGGGSGKKLNQKDTQRLAQLQQELMDLEDMIGKNQQGQRELDRGLQTAMDEGAKAANATVSEVRDIVEAWGMEAGNSNVKMSIDKRRKSIERVRRSPRLKQLTDLIGRFRKLATEKKKQKIPDGYSIHTVEIGNNLQRILPSEMMKLSNPAMKADFMRRFHQKELLQYKKQDTKTKGQGPVVTCHDKSGSMDGEKDDWSTALTLATLEIAQKEKRNFAYIPYEWRMIDECYKNILAGELDPDDIMDIAELGTRGGTNFQRPLEEALHCLQSSNYKKGDILFITDGDGGIADEFLNKFKAEKARLEFFVHTVLINTDGGASRGTVEKFSDHITTISSLAELDDANAKEIFRITDNKDKYAMAAANAAAQVQGLDLALEGDGDDEDEAI